VKLRKQKEFKPSPKVFLARYGDRMAQMKVGNVLYVTYFGARTRIQRTGIGEMDYTIEIGCGVDYLYS
jgi:hypothetical protein